MGIHQKEYGRTGELKDGGVVAANGGVVPANGGCGTSQKGCEFSRTHNYFITDAVPQNNATRKWLACTKPT